jgi:hypothetical protein
MWCRIPALGPSRDPEKHTLRTEIFLQSHDRIYQSTSMTCDAFLSFPRNRSGLDVFQPCCHSRLALDDLRYHQTSTSHRDLPILVMFSQDVSYFASLFVLSRLRTCLSCQQIHASYHPPDFPRSALPTQMLSSHTSSFLIVGSLSPRFPRCARNSLANNPPNSQPTPSPRNRQINTLHQHLIRQPPTTVSPSGCIYLLWPEYQWVGIEV